MLPDEPRRDVPSLPDGLQIEANEQSGVLSFNAPRLETLGMFALETA